MPEDEKKGVSVVKVGKNLPFGPGWNRLIRAPPTPGSGITVSIDKEIRSAYKSSTSVCLCNVLLPFLSVQFLYYLDAKHTFRCHDGTLNIKNNIIMYYIGILYTVPN